MTDPISAKRELAYIPDDPKLFDALTVREHLEFIAATYRVTDWVPKAECSSSNSSWWKSAIPWPRTSRGMRQKVAICCAYLHDPRDLLFDEPLTGLDPYAIRTLKASIAQRAAAGAAIMVSSHLLSLVEDLCTHLLILHKGRCLFHGTWHKPGRNTPTCRVKPPWKKSSSCATECNADFLKCLATHLDQEPIELASGLDRDPHEHGALQALHALEQGRDPPDISAGVDVSRSLVDLVHRSRSWGS